MNFKRKIYLIYRKFYKNRLCSTVISFIYTRLLLVFRRSAFDDVLERTSLSDSTNSTNTVNPVKSNFKDTKIAFICDEMTWQDFKDECQSAYITPKGWKKIISAFKPDIVFCESAWSGIEKYKDCWRGQIYKSKDILYENRKVLLDIIKYCNRNNIKTVFWNKEDPLYFDDPSYNFSDTAVRFDCVFTTARESVKRYEKLGHKNVHTLMFGYSHKLFYTSENKKDNVAVFAGSWYADQKERCEDLVKIFDMVLDRGIKLQIYDRQSESKDADNIFPERYRHYIMKKMPYDQLVKVFQNAEYAININTVKNSSTMFARRVFEVMACGCVVVSNESQGLREMFQGRIWFYGEQFDFNRKDEIVAENLKYIFQNHTCEKRLAEICTVIEDSV